MDDTVIKITELFSFFTHETKLESLFVMAAPPSVHIASHLCHLIFCLLKKLFITSKTALPVAFPLETYKIRYVPQFLLCPELSQTSPIQFHLKPKRI
jgi:hypothetical protein